MHIVVITPAGPVPHETETLRALLDRKVRIHLRKPGWPPEALTLWINSIPRPQRKYLSLHVPPLPIQELQLGGWHLKSNTPTDLVPASWNGRLSRSFHTLEEIEQYSGPALHYGFLSPIFDSISKPEYRRKFTPNTLKQFLAHRKRTMPLFALGGISPTTAREAQAMGFDGVAVLGALWHPTTVADRIKVFEQLIAA